MKLAEFQFGVPPEMFEVDDHHDVLLVGDDYEKNSDDFNVDSDSDSDSGVA